MMDSQDKALELEKNENTPVVDTPAEEVKQDAEAPEVVNEQTEEETAATAEAPEVPTTEAATPERKVYTSKQEVLERVKELAHGEEMPQKDEVDYLKTTFYKLHIAEREAALKLYIDNGGDPETYQILPDEQESAFKAEMGLIKERRAQVFKEMEAEKEANLKKKLDIIEKIKAMVTSPEEANKSFKEFKTLQEEWKEIKNVPAEKANELWRNYQLYVEQFYDLLKLNSEAREYDFKKNLELKTRLCEAAEKLADETDIISAFHQLQKLHQEFREIGPVAKELPRLSSTSAISSISTISVPRRRRTSPVRRRSARRWRQSLPRRTRVVPTGRNIPRRLSISSRSGRPSVSLHRR